MLHYEEKMKIVHELYRKAVAADDAFQEALLEWSEGDEALAVERRYFYTMVEYPADVARLYVEMRTAAEALRVATDALREERR